MMTDTPTVQDPDTGRWAYRVQCPGESPYQSPFVYDTEEAALGMRNVELQICEGQQEDADR